jgi:uncharacterized membrane protein
VERLPRLFDGLVVALAAATVVAMIALWPGDVENTLDAGLVAESESATVERVEEFACAGFNTDTCRNVTVRLNSGPDEGDTAEIQLGIGGIDPDLDPGDDVRVIAGAAPPGSQPGGQLDTGPQGTVYSISDFERRTPLLVLALIFAAIVLVFGRLRGALSLVGLAISLAIVLLFIVPAILDGKAPLAVALVGSLAVALTTILLAHGRGPKSIAALLGTAGSLALTAALAVLFVNLTHLTGLSSEEAVILQLNTGEVSFEGLLLAGMIIAALGVLDDVTISQSSTVMALRAANPSLGFRELFVRAMNVGRDHVSATVNTLVLAYVGASLPILLLFSSGELGFTEVANLELVAKEIVGTLVGSIGLIAAVPITTALAALLSAGVPPDELAAEAEHAHSH